MRAKNWLASQTIHLWLLAFCVAPSLRAAINSQVWEQQAGFRSARVEIAPTDHAPGFVEMLPTRTGVAFTNLLDDQAILQNQNLMLGSGVATGDFDGDGWCDLYLCSITGRNALFRNRGGWRFEDVTESAGVSLPGNTNTGAVFVDVDGDGRLDLLVSSLGNGVGFFRNNGDGTFRNCTAQSGLSSHTGALTMTLADVDGDGDLDLYVCNYGAVALVKRGGDYLVKLINGHQVLQGPGAERMRVVEGRIVELGEPDTLFLNEGGGKFHAVPWDSDYFRDEDGKPMPAPWDFGLSAQMRDVNGDGTPDIYVCNDFDTPDRFWINNGHGRFQLLPRLAQRSQSFASMGVDFADLDRDGHLDFLVVEMLSPDHDRRLRQRDPSLLRARRPGVFDDRPEISQNTLFQARGDGTYAELARWAGLAASDWSWQGSFLDVDLDGFEDLLVVTGHWRDVQDLDVPDPAPGHPRLVRASLLASPHLFTSNRAWRNRGQLTFEDRSGAWGFSDTNVCHGMALADFDNDGDLDVAINRLNAPALILCNIAAAPRVGVRLKGRGLNTHGIGARITLRGGAVETQTQEMICGGKYLSGDDAMRMFAAGAADATNLALEIAWRSGARSTVSNVLANRIYEIDEPTAALATGLFRPTNAAPAIFADATAELAHEHHETSFPELDLQPLMTRFLSQRGPGVCVCDLDGDGHDDIVVGAGRGGRIIFHRGDGAGRFRAAARSEPVPDDVLGLVSWTRAPGTNVLLATMANYEGALTNSFLWELTLHGDVIQWRPAADPDQLLHGPSASRCLAVADFDGDGDLDVFVGAHAIPRAYPLAAPSQLLRNHRGELRLDGENSAAVVKAGLVNAALWADLDNDGWPELVLACEWGPVRILKNDRGRLRETTAALGLASYTGWWTGLATADFDGDGRLDIVVGNWGLNAVEQASPAQPLRLYFGDFLRRGTMDLIETEYSGIAPEPMPSRRLDEVSRALPELRARFATHRAWAAATAKEVLAPWPSAREVSATTLATTLFLNRGDHFEPRALPREAQLAPAWGVVASDLDGDGHADIFLSQNHFALRPDRPRLDAGRGLMLRGDGRGRFQPLTGQESGLVIYGEQRGAALGDFNDDGRADLAVSQNGAATRLWQNMHGTPRLRVRLAGPPANPNGLGAGLWLERSGQRGPVTEVSGGSGWFSQNSSTVLLTHPLIRDEQTELHVRWPGGQETRTAIPPLARQLVVNPDGELSK